MTISPPDDVLRDTLKELRSQNPTLGTSKLLALLLSQHEDWAVSEKRTKKILTSEKLILPPQPSKSNKTSASVQHLSGSDATLYPKSRTIDNLDVSHWSKKVKVVDFGPPKGKGLVATDELEKGEVIWKEDPFAIAPEWDIYNLQIQSRACAFCTTPLSSLAGSLGCPSSTNTHLAASTNTCPARFCNRLCLTRAQRVVHPLVCPTQNPAVVPLLDFARRSEWLACHALAQCIARILMAHAQNRPQDLESDIRFVDSLAGMGVEERWKAAENTGLMPDMNVWKTAHSLTVQAFLEPTKAQDKKRLMQILKRPIPEDVKAKFFELEKYLHALTSMSLNIEAHGGIYVLHSHLNHSCDPNVSVRHFDHKTALSRITMQALRNIAAGEELTTTYVNPDLSLIERRRQLKPWAFGTCMCVRCKREETEEGDRGNNTEVADLPGLEQELRQGFGLL